LDEYPAQPSLEPSLWIAGPDRVPEPSDLDAGLVHLGLSDPRPVLILVGGAAHVSEAVAAELLRIFGELAPHLDALGAAVIDGGTAFGVMALMGEARRRAGARFPLLGIAPRCAVAIDERRVAATGSDPCGGIRGNRDKAPLDSNHTHFMLVPGDGWGDESPWIIAAARRLAGGRATLMLVAAGGEITCLDVMHRLQTGGRVLVLAGSGGTSDRLAEWRRDGRAIPGLDAGETERALIDVLDLPDAAARLPAVLSRAFVP
jgi:hypothetical protein